MLLVQAGTNWTNNVACYVPVSCVRFARYCCIMYGRRLYLLFAACYSLDIVSVFVVGIKCDAPCKKWLERGQCTTKWRRRCLRTCLTLGCDDEPVRPEGERNVC